MTKKLIGQPAIARHLGICERTLKRWVDRGIGVPVVIVGRVWYAEVTELENWMKYKGTGKK